MRQFSKTLTVRTPGPGLVEISERVLDWTAALGMQTGLLTIFCRHTSASLLIQENAAKAVRTDLEAFFARIAPQDPARYDHDDEGPDDMPAHLRTALTGVSLAIPLVTGRLQLGTWQGIYVFEHRDAPHERQIVFLLQGE